MKCNDKWEMPSIKGTVLRAEHSVKSVLIRKFEYRYEVEIVSNLETI